MLAPIRAILTAVVVLLPLSACWRSPCCTTDDDCATLATCFEGMCRARCTHESACLEGEHCVDGVCLATRRVMNEACPFTPVDVLPVDAGEPEDDAGTPPPPDDAGTPPCSGPEEPNDTPFTATLGVTSGVFDICEGDNDFFAVALVSGDRIDARIRFENDDGDLDMELWSPDGDTLERSQGIGDEERIRRVVDEDGFHYIRVYGFAGATNVYNLTIGVEVAP